MRIEVATQSQSVPVSRRSPSGRPPSAPRVDGSPSFDVWRACVAAWLTAAAVLAAFPIAAHAASLDFEVRATERTLKLAQTGAKSQGELRATLARLMPGDPVTIGLEITPLDAEADHFFEVALDVTEVVLDGGANAREFVTVLAQSMDEVEEGAEEIFVLTATAASGTRQLSLKIVVDEQEPLITIGRDASGRPERTTALARGGRAAFPLELANLGVRVGLFSVSCTAPPGWEVGLPQLPSVTKIVGTAVQDLELTVQASEQVAAGARATVLVKALSLDTQEVSTLELEVENGGHFHVASATGGNQAHLVQPGDETTWVARLFPFEDGPRNAALELTSSTPDWEFGLSPTAVVLDPATGPEEVTVFARAPEGAAAGTVGEFTLSATVDLVGEEMSADLVARVTAVPRIYIVAIDALGAGYPDLDQAGTGPGSEDDWLMPRLRGLMQRGTAYTNANTNLPSVTDPNHLNIMCGTLTGTVGVPAVQSHFGGRDELGRPVRVYGSREFLRYGPGGEQVPTLFDGVRTLEPLARGALVSGKYWVNELLEDGGATLQISVSGKVGPDYAGRPEVYVLGDPASDPDRESDPGANWAFGELGVDEFMGSMPDLAPSDAYTMESALRVIVHEDPEVMYINLASMDYAQHVMGNASDLDEWDDQGTTTTYDDLNLVNSLATREEVLDVAREADVQLGMLLDFLEARGRLDTSFVIVTADHGQVTHPEDGVQVESVLRLAGIAPTELTTRAGSSQVIIYDLDPAEAEIVENALEPLGIVYNRSEMETGVDEATGTAFALPRELYSEYWIGQDDTPGIHYRWPSLFIFDEGNEQYVVFNQFWANTHEPLLPLMPATSWLVGGHGGPAAQHVPLVLSGPGIAVGVVRNEAVRVHQIAPTLYQLLGIATPASFDGEPLPGWTVVPPPQIFEDGFEAGTPEGWSATVGLS